MLRTEHAGRRHILGMFQIPILLDPGECFGGQRMLVDSGVSSNGTEIA